MKQQMRKENYSKGQMTIIAVIALCMIFISVTISQLLIGTSEYIQSSADNRADQALELNESAIDNAIYEYYLNNTYTGGTFTSPIGNATVTLSVNNTPSPPQVTITSTATYQSITRSETAVFTISPPPAVINKAAFAQNNFYSNNSTLNGEIFTNNDFTMTGTTLNGDLYGAGKGNGQKGTIDSSTVNQYQSAGGNIYVWDPTWIQNSSTINGNVQYHTSLHVDNSSTVTGSQTKNDNSFLPAIGNPSFNWTSAKALATTNGTYYASPAAFQTYLSSIGTVSGSNVTYNLASGLYYIDCNSCNTNYTYAATDSSGHNQNITGSGVTIAVNTGFIDLGAINISSPYQSASLYYPVISTNGDLDILSATSTNINVNLTGLIYAYGSINAYGINNGQQTQIMGGAWASNQLNLLNYVTITYNQTYVQNITGFGFSNDYINAISWSENP